MHLLCNSTCVRNFILTYMLSKVFLNKNEFWKATIICWLIINRSNLDFITFSLEPFADEWDFWSRRLHQRRRQSTGSRSPWVQSGEEVERRVGFRRTRFRRRKRSVPRIASVWKDSLTTINSLQNDKKSFMGSGFQQNTI